ncbi:hypothetical protein [Comamonas sp.]|uniref:hypothetical protein n=1 Tax=Comamonas sp. TaxID=34028 RepID=UPI00258C7500|nr:hypothetical protein [Comamonas sp.]
MNLSNLLFLIGLISGIAYSIVGILAVKHLKNPTYNDRYINWTLWWCIEMDKYDEKWQNYCSIGLVLVFMGIFSWVIFYLNR